MFWSQSRRDMTPRTGCQSNIAVCLQMKDISTFQSEVMSIGRLSQLWDITGTANIYITSLISVWWQAGAGRSIVIGCQLQWSMWCIWHWWPWGHQARCGDKTMVTPDTDGWPSGSLWRDGLRHRSDCRVTSHNWMWWCLFIVVYRVVVWCPMSHYQEVIIIMSTMATTTTTNMKLCTYYWLVRSQPQPPSYMIKFCHKIEPRFDIITNNRPWPPLCWCFYCCCTRDTCTCAAGTCDIQQTVPMVTIRSIQTNTV